MSWAKLSDDYSDDCWTLSDEAFRLHTEALVWNGRKLLDCRIPKDDLRRFAKHPHAVGELLACGWWTEDGDYYVLRHHALYQRTREAVVNQQAANAANGAKGGRPKKPREQSSALQSESETHSLSDSPTGSGTERDRTGQDRQLRERQQTETTTSNGYALASRCQHGITNGDQPDPWLDGRLSCPECALSRAAV
jgi:hypothetical protein